MKFAVIADDLTGANDTGVQFAKYDWKVSVLLGDTASSLRPSDRDVLVWDTDSRSVSLEVAYRRTAAAVRDALQLGAETLFKKLDSTMRGNLGAELDAVYEEAKPDFIVIAPAFPDAGRQIVNGKLLVGGIPVDETEFAKDPKTPVPDADVPSLISRQSKYGVQKISTSLLAEGASALEPLLADCKQKGIPYLLVDASGNEDLKRTADLFNSLQSKLVWAGSAGIAHYLAAKPRTAEGHTASEQAHSFTQASKPALLVVGSVSGRSRRQLQLVLEQPLTRGIMVEAHLTVGHAEARTGELQRAALEAIHSLQAGCDTVIYSSGDAEAIKLAQETGAQYGLAPHEVSDAVSKALGEAAVQVMDQSELAGVVMTGGDTAKQVCSLLGSTEFQLIGEVETGVPIGRMTGKQALSAVTKAGGFGTDRALLNAMAALKGEMKE